MVEMKDKLYETVALLLLRVSAIERVLVKDGVITQERYCKEMESCTSDMNTLFDSMNVSKDSNKILS
jgi:hypothetical protein